MVKPRVIIVPGNGCTPVQQSNWYSYLENRLSQSGLFSAVILKDMPDPIEAKEHIWIPYIIDVLGADQNTILIGHSSGAVAAMRLLEKQKLFGCVLVSACHTDLGCESERISNYYSRPWEWNLIRSNSSNFLLQYHSIDDPFIPPSEADHVARMLQLTMRDSSTANVAQQGRIVHLEEAQHNQHRIISVSGSDRYSYTCFSNRSHFFSSRDVEHIPLVLQDILSNLCN